MALSIFNVGTLLILGYVSFAYVEGKCHLDEHDLNVICIEALKCNKFCGSQGVADDGCKKLSDTVKGTEPSCSATNVCTFSKDGKTVYVASRKQEGATVLKDCKKGFFVLDNPGSGGAGSPAGSSPSNSSGSPGSSPGSSPSNSSGSPSDSPGFSPSSSGGSPGSTPSSSSSNSSGSPSDSPSSSPSGSPIGSPSGSSSGSPSGSPSGGSPPSSDSSNTTNSGTAGGDFPSGGSPSGGSPAGGSPSDSSGSGGACSVNTTTTCNATTTCPGH
ncbi:hypothetical protein WDU94_010671 [Cyamophila willieti]